MAAPKSYLNRRRPPVLEAIALEQGTIREATEVLERKGYFTPPPRPWTLGGADMGLGRMNYAVLDRFGDLVVKTGDRSTAELIITAVNAMAKPGSKKKKGI
jgi:hypothetical protein